MKAFLNFFRITKSYFQDLSSTIEAMKADPVLG